MPIFFPDELKELVKVSLQQDGILGKIKAQLRVASLLSLLRFFNLVLWSSDQYFSSETGCCLQNCSSGDEIEAWNCLLRISLRYK